jgi:hypothetical protein
MEKLQEGDGGAAMRIKRTSVLFMHGSGRSSFAAEGKHEVAQLRESESAKAEAQE